MSKERKKSSKFPPGFIRTKEGLVYFRDPRYGLRSKAKLPSRYGLADSTTPSHTTQLPEDVDAKITADGRVHLFRQRSLTIVDLNVGEVSYYEMPSRAEAVMGWCEAIFPRRVAREEIGDVLELINRWRNDPTCRHVRAKIVVKVVSTVLVLIINSIGFVVSSLRGKKAE